MNDNAELRARRWLAEQLAWERRFEELREAAGIEGAAGFDARPPRPPATATRPSPLPSGRLYSASSPTKR